MSQLKRYNGSSWEVVGGNPAPKTSTTSSDSDVYSCNYINSTFTPTVLYDGGNTGESGTITLNDDWDKYNYIEIFYRRSEFEIMSSKAPTDLADAECLPIQGLCCYYGYGSGFWIGWKLFKFLQSNKRSVIVEYGNMYITGSGMTPATDTTNTIRALKIIGWK